MYTKHKRVDAVRPTTRSGLHFLGVHIKKERDKKTRVEAELRHCSEVHSEVSRELLQPRVRERKTGGGARTPFPHNEHLERHERISMYTLSRRVLTRHSRK